MTHKATKAELEQRLLETAPLREYFYARENNERDYIVKSSQPIDKHREPYVVKYVGASRASGGVVVEASSVRMMFDWCHDAEHHSDPYRRELAHKVRRLHSDALDELYGSRSYIVVSLDGE